MNPLFSEFKRKFSRSMYKNMKIALGEMSFFKDFIHDNRGDLYPIAEKSDDCIETIEHNLYTVMQGSVKRMFCQFFPYATYEIHATVTHGQIGFSFCLPQTEAVILTNGEKVFFTCGDQNETVILSNPVKNDCVMIVSCRPGAFDIYFRDNGKPEFLHTFYAEQFKDANRGTVFADSYVHLSVSGKTTAKEVLAYLDNGVSIADIKPIKYENGDVMVEQGKIYLTASIRNQEGNMQGIFSWIPGTAEIELTGALFFDCGDGKWRNYIASSILRDRKKEQWYVWTSSFEHEHILAHGAFDGDPRFGINVVDVRLMEKTADVSDITVFAGIKGDEDPDLFYDANRNSWLLSICRLDPKTKKYVYVFFESKDPFSDYTYIGRSIDGVETGGSFLRMNDEIFFVCGNAYDIPSNYRIYGKHGMTVAKFNYPDGGFRGWGSVFAIKQGSKTRYYWLTFDRHNGSSYNWSYGNLYCFEISI